MVEILKLGDRADGACLPPTTLFTANLGALTNVFVGTQRSPVLVLGDACPVVDCDAGPSVLPCIPTLNNNSCSPNVFAGIQKLPVGISQGVTLCEYVTASVIPSLVNVN